MSEEDPCGSINEKKLLAPLFKGSKRFLNLEEGSVVNALKNASIRDIKLPADEPEMTRWPTGM